MGSAIFGIDASSFQGNVDWERVDRVCDFGAEKVTEGSGATAYANPYWPVAKIKMDERARASGFVPIAYLFLDAGETGAAQADFFCSKAGLLTGFAIVVDVERAPNGSPSIASAHACVDRLRQLYPDHPIGGYVPHWYSGNGDLKFFDWLWASSYVGGSGEPPVLYFSVPSEWWAPYGGKEPALLQFTDKATVAGVNGTVDCSAFRGTQEQLARMVLPRRAAPVPAPPPAPAPAPAQATSAEPLVSADTTVLVVEPGAVPLPFPVQAQQDKGEPAPWKYASLVVAGAAGAVVKAVLHLTDGTSTAVTVPLADGKAARVAADWGKVAVFTLTRLDSKADLGAVARFITW